MLLRECDGIEAHLVGVTVTNYVNGGAFPVFFPTNLLRGQSATFTGSYVPADPCNPSTATLVAVAVDQFTATPQRVVSTNLTTCSAVITRGIKVTIVDKTIGYELRCSPPIPMDAEIARDLGYASVTYLLKGGFRDGKPGLIISLVNSYYVMLKFAKLWELQRD